MTPRTKQILDFRRSQLPVRSALAYAQLKRSVGALWRVKKAVMNGAPSRSASLMNLFERSDF